jgi:NADH:ubiquinone oxidoreductase subunit 6 (subunit J)
MTGGAWYWVLFGICAAWVIVTGIGVVALKNIVHAAVSLVMCFLGVAFVYVLLNAGFVAIVQILLYVGAISVVILFAIMLTEQQRGKLSLFFNRQSIFALPLVVAVMLVLTILALSARLPLNGSESHNPTLEALAKGLFNEYVYPFELVSFVLLAAMIGAILLARREDEDR